MAEIKIGTRKRLFEEVKGRCFYCGVRLIPEIITWDHIIARNKGGCGTIENLCACCRGCNAVKGIHSIEVFRNILRQSRELNCFTFYFELIGLKKNGAKYGKNSND